MIVLGILGSFAVIGLLCWLLFTLAVFALPFFVGLNVGIWTHQAGAGLFGAFLIGAFAFAAPAALAGFYATRGVVHTMPSETWQLVFSVIGAAAVGITAFVRVTALATPEASVQGIATA